VKSPVTEEIYGAKDLEPMISDVLTFKPEDQGMGAYEYAGATGVDVYVVMVIQEPYVYVDITKTEDHELPNSIKGRLWSKSGLIEFTATLYDEPFQQGDKLLQTYEISQ